MFGGDDESNIFGIVSLAISLGVMYGNDKASTSSVSIREIDDIGTRKDRNFVERIRLREQLTSLSKDLVRVKQGFGRIKRVEDDDALLFTSLRFQAETLLRTFRAIQLITTTNAQNINLVHQFEISIQGISEILYKLGLKLENKVPVRVCTASDLVNHILKQPAYTKFRGSLALEDFEVNYRSLDSRFKHCLFCFSVFPEGSVVSKQALMYWWIGEGFYDPKDNLTDEFADEIMSKFLEMGFIELIVGKGKLIGFKMHPVIRYAVIYLAERAGFMDFDFNWNPTADFSSCQRACLVKTEEGSSTELLLRATRLNPEKLLTLFNVNDHFLYFKTQWFSSIRNAKVICLGRWEAGVENDIEIEVEDTKFLQGLKNMKHLKFLSLRGISGIRELPIAARKLESLMVLDLNACRDFEALPNDIGSLRSLTHLDMSECYLPDYMPKGLELLTNLQVLKGFMIDDSKKKRSCTLEDLAELMNLRKLSIVTNKVDFPKAEELHALNRFAALRILSICWGAPLGVYDAKSRRRSDFRRRMTTNAFQLESSGAMEVLEKLDLRGISTPELPSWIIPEKLKCLKKLYIRGGHLSNLVLPDAANQHWNVKILRLHYLKGFQMDWRALQDVFPELIYLDKVECPKLDLFPCDDDGVWLKRNMSSENSMENLGFKWSYLLRFHRSRQGSTSDTTT